MPLFRKLLLSKSPFSFTRSPTMMTDSRAPSDILGSLKNSLPSDDFLRRLENDLYPVLDALPKLSKSKIVSALAKVDRENADTNLTANLGTIDP